MRSDHRPPDRPEGPDRSRRRRDRRGRGVRGALAPTSVPVSRSRSEAFDDLVLDAVEELEEHWAAELAGVQFAVEDVPLPNSADSPDFDPEVVTDRGIALGRLHRHGIDGHGVDGPDGVGHGVEGFDIGGPGAERPGTVPVIVLYRRPIEARAVDRDDRGDLVFMVVAELVAELLGKDLDDLG